MRSVQALETRTSHKEKTTQKVENELTGWVKKGAKGSRAVNLLLLEPGAESWKVGMVIDCGGCFDDNDEETTLSFGGRDCGVSIYYVVRNTAANDPTCRLDARRKIRV
jgi:hypothetical protein